MRNENKNKIQMKMKNFRIKFHVIYRARHMKIGQRVFNTSFSQLEILIVVLNRISWILWPI